MTDRATLAREALVEITSANDVGPLISETDEGEGVTTLLFQTRMLGYPGWH